MDLFVGDDNFFVSLLVFPSVSSLAPIMLMSIPNLFCVSVLFPLLLGSSSSSSMELLPKDLPSSSDFSSSSKKSSTCLFSVVFPDDVQPSYISAHDYPLCVNIQEPVYISRMIICISNKHSCFSSHQISPLPFESIPAWISMALALPINIGILLSATEFC